MLGVFGLVKVDDENDYRMADAEDPTAYDATKFPDDQVAKNFFEAILKKYQWFALLLAKRPVEKTDSWRAISYGHYEAIDVSNSVSRQICYRDKQCHVMMHLFFFVSTKVVISLILRSL